MTLSRRGALLGLGGALLALLERLNNEINKALGEPAFVQRLRQIGVEPVPLTVGAFRDFIRNDSS
jgi:hypothetical protein